jgi:hypothetical protein
MWTVCLIDRKRTYTLLQLSGVRSLGITHIFRRLMSRTAAAIAWIQAIFPIKKFPEATAHKKASPNEVNGNLIWKQ